MKIVNYGGGTNSTALLVEGYNRGIVPDLIVFADPGNEMPRTYAYLSIFAAWCESVDFPEIDVVRWIRRDGTFLSIEQVSLRDKTLPSKAYGLAGCTSKWKQQPIDKFIVNHPRVREAWARGEVVERWIGYDADEPSRAERMLEKNPQPSLKSAGRVAWKAPLFDWNMGRDECVAVIAAAGLPSCGKSSCFFCPSMKKHEITALAPELLARALRMEDAARPGLTTVKGLGRNYAWRDFIEQQAEAVGAREIVEPECGCYDGD